MSLLSKAVEMLYEETVFKMTEVANELFAHGDYDESIMLLQSIDRLCDCYHIDMPDEAVNLNIAIDSKFGIDLFARTLLHTEIVKMIAKS